MYIYIYLTDIKFLKKVRKPVINDRQLGDTYIPKAPA